MHGFIMRLSAFLGVSALALTLLAVAPAQAARPDAQRSTTSAASAVKHTKPVVVFHPGGTQGHTVRGGPSSLGVDWQWLQAAWYVHLSKAETERIAWSAGACTTFIGIWLPKPWALAIYLACAGVATAAGIATLYNQCLSVRVPVSGFGTTMYRRNC